MDYRTLNARLQGRNHQSRKVGNNTYLQRRGENIAVMLHSTDVVTFQPNGDIVLDSGGWKTVTTKARMNDWLPRGWFVTQRDGVWFLGSGYNDKNPHVYEDGITLQKGMELGAYFIKGAGSHNPKTHRTLKRRISKYAKLCADNVPLDQPNSGDCWYCHLGFDKIGRDSDRQASHSTEHLESHMSEGYVVPSLVLRALDAFHNAPMAYWQTFKNTSWESDRSFGKHAVRTAVRRYMKTAFGLSA